MSVANQLKIVRDTLQDHVTLVAVSKTHPIESIQAAYDAGQRIFGESRPQELREKYEALPRDIEWHMIGHLQTNKVKYIAPYVALIQSVDSLRLLEAIQREAQKCGRVIDILFEIHVAQEDSKTGWNFEELQEMIQAQTMSEFKNVRVRGVMGIASNSEDEALVRRDFETLKADFECLKPQFGEAFDTLSMGMSGDYQLAMACGSTMVRVGSFIFGARDYSK